MSLFTSNFPRRAEEEIQCPEICLCCVSLLKVAYVEVSVKNICVVGEIFLTDNIQTYRVRY